ncbi:efflux RND transporter periplasmic adaptor subunit [Legionella lytica]|uniref:Efflux RND transporter periplasmic adaptor subunit n=1 Tax=Legionella lytica TaxID=96232 RepID=A0ABY4Y988_9GAMM|nr:efflux RND transporter periplasmic adaptor subunit [Legionella lytica]USQ14071.1 efflux RND transporter periplasmic adaptor subunit [Legionella lytica]
MFEKMQLHLKDKRHRHYVIGIAIFLLIVLLLIIFRIHAAIVLRNRTIAEAVTVVRVLEATTAKGTDKIILPGNVWAWHEAPIFARTNGYVRTWYVDIGSHVKAGDLLAEIETPELDAQQRQAVADLNTAIANSTLAQSTAKRWVNLLKTDSVSKQETDEKVSSAKALQAAMVSAKENLVRLNKLVGFQRVIAPFDGVITARATDIGALINEGSSTTAKPLFRIAQTNPLRIYVKVPQNLSTRLTDDMQVSLHFSEHPNKVFMAKLFETARAIDPNTRTLLAQFTAENKEELMLSGSYTEVWFTFPLPPNTVRLPVNTLIFQAAGLQVAVVDKNNKIQLKSVTIRRDFGAEVEIATGVTPGERIVLNPPDSISNDEVVRVAS